MTANAGNPALGTVQPPGPPAIDGTAVVACAIHCCDKKPYPLPNTCGGRKTCQRLGSKKHSCVLHRLREKTPDGKLTKKNRVEGVLASPRCKAPGTLRTLIPDTIVNGVVIDAKFPCETSKVHGPKDNPAGTGDGFGTRQYLSTSASTTMETKKELTEYIFINDPVKVTDVTTMTPSDAATAKGNCQC